MCSRDRIEGLSISDKGRKAVSADDVKAIAELPTKDQLLGQIAGLISGFARDIAVCVNGVSSGLARSIQQVSEQKAA